MKLFLVREKKNYNNIIFKRRTEVILSIYFFSQNFESSTFILSKNTYRNNIISRSRSHIIVQLTNTEKERWNAIKIMRILSPSRKEKKRWNAMKMTRILSPSRKEKERRNAMKIMMRILSPSRIIWVSASYARPT